MRQWQHQSPLLHRAPSTCIRHLLTPFAPPKYFGFYNIFHKSMPVAVRDFNTLTICMIAEIIGCVSLTNPCLSEMLLVSLSLWKETILVIHWSPVSGESGWMYIRFGISGSAFPATIHRELWNLYRLSSTGTMSINRMYLAFLSRPLTLTLYGGNIRLQITVAI